MCDENGKFLLCFSLSCPLTNSPTAPKSCRIRSKKAHRSDYVRPRETHTGWYENRHKLSKKSDTKWFPPIEFYLDSTLYVCYEKNQRAIEADCWIHISFSRYQLRQRQSNRRFDLHFNSDRFCADSLQHSEFGCACKRFHECVFFWHDKCFLHASSFIDLI